MKSSIKLLTFASIATLLFTSCNEDYMNTFPTSSTSTETIFQDTDAAKMAINGMARLMVNQFHSTQTSCGEGTIKFLHGEYMGEHFSRPKLTGWYTVMNGVFMDNDNSYYTRYPWAYYYMLIGNANTFIANIDNAAGLEAERQFLKAQALTYRAFAYAQLINFYCYRWDDSNNGTSVKYPTDGLMRYIQVRFSARDVSCIKAN
ncbi:RagB/SusD family nutrient uptake outer membrane protein [Parabacteroides sp. OttesenSCG-928-J18]|nr:RagB/SusD family nutrient uptake outer membrane protein [Parabacteroides sp. OttesenSCG-928-J18]